MPLYAYLSAIIVSLISFVGLSALSFKETLLKKCIFVLVSVATGALLGDAFIHLIPESFENGNNPVSTSLFILGGILVFFILEKILHWHHSHEGKHNIHGISHEEEETETTKPLGTLILASDGFHNLIDGIIIGTSYAISIEVGIATTVAIILHEIPQEVSDFAILIHSGFSKARALFTNFLSALAALVGVTFAVVLNTTSSSLVPSLVAFAAGSFIYIAGSDLVPELQKTRNIKKSIVQLIAILFGIGIMLLFLTFEK